MGIASLAVLVLYSLPVNDVSKAVEKHNYEIDKIKSYYIRVESETTEDEEPGKPLIRDSVLEFWSEGNSFRHRSRDLYFVDPDGKYFLPENEHGNVSDTSYGITEVRSLRGWDAEHPFTLPLDFGRNAGDFGKVKASLGVRDPISEVNSQALFYLGHRMMDGVSLRELIRIASLDELPSKQKSIVRLKVTDSKDPKLARWIGAVLDIDTDHGWLVRRLEWNAINTSTGLSLPAGYNEVKEFEEAVSGIWIPSETVTYVKGEIVGRTRITKVVVNSSLNPSDLVVSFPEGARVNDISGEIHRWGKDQPAESFPNFDTFMEHLYDRARESQRVKGHPRPVNVSSDRRLFVIANIVLIALSILIFVIRRMISRSAGVSVEGDVTRPRPGTGP